MIWQEGLSQPNESRKELSEKELQVLALIARGYSNWAISRELKVSEKSVEAKLTSIYEKLSLQTDTKQLNSRVAAALHFYGLISGGGLQPGAAEFFGARIPFFGREAEAVVVFPRTVDFQESLCTTLVAPTEFVHHAQAVGVAWNDANFQTM